MCHILRPYKIDDVSFSRLNQNNFEIFIKIATSNTSFVVRVIKLVA
jgi:hypothetical protein